MSSAIAMASARAGAEPPFRRLPEAPAPSLDLDRLGGGRLAATDRRGAVVLVHFFATWCEPCRPELASLDRLRNETSQHGLDVLAVSVAEVEGRLSRFFADRPVGFPVLMDRDRSASRAWGIDALPSTIVLDRTGRPRLAVRGDLDWQRADVGDALVALLAKTDRPKQPEGN